MTEKRQRLSAKKLGHLTVLSENLEMVETLKSSENFNFDFSKRFDNAFEEISVEIENSLEDRDEGGSEVFNNNSARFFLLEDEVASSSDSESSSDEEISEDEYED